MKNFLSLYETLRFITVFVTGLYPQPDKSSSRIHALYLLRSILTISSYLHLGLPTGVFLLGLPIKMCAFLISRKHATWSVHLTLLDLVTLIILREDYKLRSSLLCRFLQFQRLPFT